MNHIRRRPGVDDDILGHAAYLAARSERAAFRFVDSVQQTLKDLARMPGIGSPKRFDVPALAKVRTWWVKGFRNYLIYYLPLKDGIDVLAIMHGAQLPEERLNERARK